MSNTMAAIPCMYPTKLIPACRSWRQNRNVDLRLRGSGAERNIYGSATPTEKIDILKKMCKTLYCGSKPGSESASTIS